VGKYVDIGGLDTWYDEAGQGEPLVLLHGGMCTNETWGAQTQAFSEGFRTLAPERRAHGHTADVEGPLTYGDMATDTIGFLGKVVGGPAHLVGWSDGGIVGLMVAIARPDLVRKLVVIGTNYDTAGVPRPKRCSRRWLPTAQGWPGSAGSTRCIRPTGPEHWSVAFAKFVEMAQREPHIAVADLARISASALVLIGDDDMVSLEHTASLYRAIPNAELAVVPGASHTVLMEKPELMNRIVLDFLEQGTGADDAPLTPGRYPRDRELSGALRRAQKEGRRDARVVAAAGLLGRRGQLLEFDQPKLRADDRRDDLAEPAPPFLEVALAPTQPDGVDAVEHGVAVAEQQAAVLAQGGGERGGEEVEVGR
jgi:pimeloyl-ACP methyl ester carboxylesterase